MKFLILLLILINIISSVFGIKYKPKETCDDYLFEYLSPGKDLIEVYKKSPGIIHKDRYDHHGGYFVVDILSNSTLYNEINGLPPNTELCDDKINFLYEYDYGFRCYSQEITDENTDSYPVMCEYVYRDRYYIFIYFGAIFLIILIIVICGIIVFKRKDISDSCNDDCPNNTIYCDNDTLPEYTTVDITNSINYHLPTYEEVIAEEANAPKND